MHDRLTAALRSRWFDAALALGLLGVGGLEVLLVPGALNMSNTPHAPVAAVGFVAICAMAAAWRRHAVAAGCATAGLLLIDGVLGEFASNPVTVLLACCLLAYGIGACSETRRSVAGIAAMIAMLEAGVAIAHDAWVPFLFVIAPWIGGRAVRAQRAIAEALEQRTQELEAEQDAYARLAVRHERARIARELHDVVSHNLAVMVVQAGAGRVAPPAALDRAAGRFASIRRAGEHGLDELSRLGELLRSQTAGADDGGPIPHVNILIEQARAAGLTIRERASPVDVPLPRDVEQTAYRIVQEALTNAVKHAPGACLTVRIAVGDGALEIDVWDDGAGYDCDLDESGSGIGLAGMAERVRTIGGTLSAGADPSGGWRVSARLPAPVRDP